MNRIADLRTGPQTIAEADSLMAEISRVEVAAEKYQATINVRLQKMREACQARLAEFAAELQPLQQQLGDFVRSHPDLFQKPRKRKTECGSYGMQHACQLVVDDIDAARKAVVAQGLDDCYEEPPVKLLKKPITVRLKGDETIPGCRLEEGDTAVYKTDPELLKQARNQ